jgi:hypothetical protein
VISRFTKLVLPVVLYGCETQTLTLREQHRLRLFENRVRRRIFGSKMGEMRGGWRNFPNQDSIIWYVLLPLHTTNSKIMKYLLH